MIFHEIYNVYYTAIRKILTKAAKKPASIDIQKIFRGTTYPCPSIIEEIWSDGSWFLSEDGKYNLKYPPTTPLTLLEKRWLKSLEDDPRLKLFDEDLWQKHLKEPLKDVSPLFTKEDYRVYDRHSEGDPYDEKKYIEIFRTFLKGIHEQTPIVFLMHKENQKKQFSEQFIPKSLEYSMKDDRFRIEADGHRYPYFNLSNIEKIESEKTGKIEGFKDRKMIDDPTLELKLEVQKDGKDTLERILLHFAHHERVETKTEDDKTYSLCFKYKKKRGKRNPDSYFGLWIQRQSSWS